MTPLNPTFIVKLEFTVLYIIFLIFAKKKIVGTRYKRCNKADLRSNYNLYLGQK